MIQYLCFQKRADVAELADALDLGSSSKEWGFDSSHPHQMTPYEVSFFVAIEEWSISSDILKKTLLFSRTPTTVGTAGTPLPGN